MIEETVNLGKVCEILDTLRKPITKKFRKQGQYPYYGATGIVDYVNDYIFDETLVLIGEDGAKWDKGDQTAFIVSGKYWVNNHAHVIRPFKDKLNQKFLVYYLNSIDLKPWVTGLTVPKLNQEKLKSIPIPLPSIEEQENIVAKLDEAFIEIDENINNRKKNYDEFSLLKLSILKKMFDGPKIELGNLYEITSSKRVFKSEWKEKGVPFYRAREIVKLANNKPFKNPIYISEDMYDLYSKKYDAPKEGDILITGVGTLGITYLVKKNDRFYFKDGNIIWLKKKDTNINSNYIESVFKSPFVRAQITNSIGATVGTLTIQKAKKLSIPYPSLEIQNKIMNKIGNFFSYAYDYEKKILKNINNYITLKSSLVKNCFESKSA
jgi:type I restriction enzyme, S subunit